MKFGSSPMIKRADSYHFKISVIGSAIHITIKIAIHIHLCQRLAAFMASTNCTVCTLTVVTRISRSMTLSL